ncbi:MAG: MFS transporter [Rhodospirillales bacterium]|nr:MFS transporter [Rhodospirillales bacterium]
MNPHHQKGWRSPKGLLILISAAMPLSLGTWMALINNFAIERAAFDGADIGMLQSIREIPGFLAFAVVFLLLLFREQTLAMIALMMLGIGTAFTGLFPTFWGLCATTLFMSVGFHYYETVRQSLALQWLEIDEAPTVMGKLVAVGSFASLVSYGVIYFALDFFGLSMEWVYALGGGLTAVLTLFAWIAYPHFPEKVEQRKHLVLRKRYWLYYAITFLSGARRQIFTVFASFLMVEKFGYDAAAITLMFLANMAINMYVAPLIGRLISKWGERKALTLEYTGLVVVFTSYAFVDNEWWAVALYIIDHMFFAMAIAIKTYFQKIADPADIAPTAGVAFSINHIAAVTLPVALGFIWLVSPMAVFLVGAGIAFASLILARMIPPNPSEGNEVISFFRTVPA